MKRALPLVLLLAACQTAEPLTGTFYLGGSPAPDAVVAQADTICVGRVNDALVGTTNANAPSAEAQNAIYLGCMAEYGLILAR